MAAMPAKPDGAKRGLTDPFDPTANEAFSILPLISITFVCEHRETFARFPWNRPADGGDQVFPLRADTQFARQVLACTVVCLILVEGGDIAILAGLARFLGEAVKMLAQIVCKHRQSDGSHTVLKQALVHRRVVRSGSTEA